MNVELFEINYSCSPGGIDCWEATAYTSLGRSTVYSDYKTAGDAINDLLSKYPGEKFDVEIVSLNHYNKYIDPILDNEVADVLS